MKRAFYLAGVAAGTLAATLAGAAALAVPAAATTFYVTVSGLGGEPDYDQTFTTEAADFHRIFKEADPSAKVYTLSGADATREHMVAVLTEVARDANSADDLVLVLIGHGSFDGTEYKFNLPGPDISGGDLAALLDKIPARRQLVINTTECSGGSIPALQRKGRAVIAATKTGTEKNATVFARYVVEALQDPSVDTDKNEAVSALEVFQYADRKTAEFYSSQKRLATEHPVFEDLGKGSAVRSATGDSPEGAMLSTFTLERLGSSRAAALDPAKRDLLAQKEDLQQKIDVLRYQKAAMAQDDYEQQLKELLIQLAKVQAQIDH